MTIEKPHLRHIYLAALFLLALTPLLRAQDDTESHHIRLTWSEDENTLRYEVVIERAEEEQYQEVLRKFTDTFFIDVPLPPGKYRCRVTPYDFLEKPWGGSQWMYFEVLPPQEPEPPEPEQQEEAKEEPTIVYALPEPEPVEQIEYQEPLPPEEHQKHFDFYLSAAWMPLLPIYGMKNQFFGQSILISVAARFGVLYSSLSVLNIGLEAAGSWYTFNENEFPIDVITAGLNLVAQKRLPKIAFTLRLGAGISLLANSQSFHSNVGISVAWFPLEHLFLEAGLDHTHLFLEDPPGCFRPWLGIGWQF